MNRPDFSNFVAHFTKDAAPYGKDEHPGEVAFKAIKGTAYDRLVSILKSGKIIATPMPWTGCKAAAFTECPFWSLMDHAKRYSPYGVGFTKEHLFRAGGGPAIYLRPDLYQRQQEFAHKRNPGITGFDSDLYTFVTPFLPPYAPDRLKTKLGGKVADYTHEREWRVPHGFTFTLSRVQFVTVKTYEDMAKLPKDLKDAIGRKKFIIMDMYQQIENLWPTHRID